MSEVIEPSAPPSVTPVVAHEGAGPSRGWTRNHTILLLFALSLAPGLVAAAARAWWHELPPTVRVPVYALSGIFIVVACGLMLVQKDPRPGSSPE